MTETQEQHTQAPDEATQWYRENQNATLAQVEGRLNELASGYDALQSTWNELGAKEEEAHSALDTRELIRIERERARLESEAAQIANGYSLLQNEKARLAQNPDPKFDDILNGSSTKSQLFMRTFKHKLSNATALKQLMLADARARAVGLKPDTSLYFKSLEASLGLGEADRSLDDFDDSAEMQQAKSATKREPKAQEPTELTAEQASIAKDLGITSDEYAASMKNPFSQAAQTVSLDDSKEAPIEVKFEQEKPTRKTVDPAKFKPGPQSMTLTPAQVRFCAESGIDPKDYVRNALDVNSGRSAHQWYDARLKSQGLA